ncbi:type 4b pilus protein PilO2 [Thauera sp. 27]|uniref:type 4b pilus protein PilO2 n=1 Tax=Thauera sp. 27 TaxID=305700 RepID=UPI0002D3A69E|nr:type 4b pilus protein PilO2 [Thauera sp. 27]
MAHKTVQIGRHTFVGGLTWVALSRPRELKKEAIAYTSKFSCDLYVIRHGVGTSQVGTALTSDGAAARQLSLAAAVANSVAESPNLFPSSPGRSQSINDWLGVFSCGNDQYAFIAVRDGSILPNGDFIGSYVEAIEQLEHHYGIGSWAAIMGSPEVGQAGYHNFLAIELETLLALKGGKLNSPAQYQLQALKSGFTRQQIIVSGLALSIVSIGGAFWYMKKVEADQLAAIEAQRQELLALQDGAAAQVERDYPKGWHTVAVTGSFLSLCQSHITFPAPGGWYLETFICDGVASEALYRANGARADNLLAAMPSADLNPDATQAVLRKPLENLTYREDELPTIGDVQRGFVSLLQGLKVPYAVGNPESPPAPPMSAEEAKVTKMTPAEWREYTFAVGPIGLAPNAMRSVLDFNGVRVTKATYQSGKWTYEGKIYAK